MPVITRDADGIVTIHTAIRLQSELEEAEEQVEKMILEVYFKREVQLPNGKLLSQNKFDSDNILRIDCEGKPQLIEAMKIIQQAIGEERYKQITTAVIISEKEKIQRQITED